MLQPSEVEQRSETARELIERAPIYQAVSIPTALVAGTLSLVNAAGTLHRLDFGGNRVIDIRVFVLSWVTVLAASLATGLHFLRRANSGHYPTRLNLRGRAALRAILPATAVAAAVTVLFFWTGAAFPLSVSWVTLYGLALLATSYFAPRPLIVLGSAFLITGIGMMLFVHLRILTLVGYSRSDLHTTLFMALTFGLFHLVYACGTWVVHRRMQ